MLRGVLLDIDDTVYRYEPCHREGLLHAHTVAAFLSTEWLSFERFEKDYLKARKQVQGRIAGTAASHSRLLYFKELLEGKGLSHYLRATLEMDEAYWIGYAKALKPDRGCIETLEYLLERDVRIAWVSNFTVDRQIFKLRQLELDTYGILLTSEDCGKDKPKSDLFHLALEKLKLSPSQCLMIGNDYEDDILPARRVGLSALWVNAASKDRFSKVPTTANWTEIGDYLKQWLETPAKKTSRGRR